jgi:hypothetical protein
MAYAQADPINKFDPTGTTSCGTIWVDNGNGYYYIGTVDCGSTSQVGGAGDLPGKFTDDGQDGETPDTPPDPGPNYSGAVQTRLLDLRKMLGSDSDCLGWLESGMAGNNLDTFNKYYNGLDGANASGLALAGAALLSGDMSSSAAATVISGQPSPLGNGLYITINTQGAFFNPGAGIAPGDQYAQQIAQIKGGTLQMQYFVLLHELAHYFQANGFVIDNTLDKQKFNNDLVWQHCNKTIAGEMM